MRVEGPTSYYPFDGLAWTVEPLASRLMKCIKTNLIYSKFLFGGPSDLFEDFLVDQYHHLSLRSKSLKIFCLASSRLF